MNSLENEMICIHQEAIAREAMLRQALQQSGMIKPPVYKRVLPVFGDALIRLGTSLKERSYPRLNADEAAVPSFLIML
jgi:hypothetical protein